VTVEYALGKDAAMRVHNPLAFLVPLGISACLLLFLILSYRLARPRLKRALALGEIIGLEPSIIEQCLGWSASSSDRHH
jgi:hypothetical protein